MKRTVMIALLAILVAWPVMMGAQTLTGTISGKVTDEQGGVLPGVSVTLTGKTGSQTQVTDAKGEFRFLGLSPGTYSVKAELTGFRAKEQTNLDVSIGRTIDVPLALSMGGLSESVDVVANAVTIDTTTTATDTNMSQDLLFSMPLSHNNPAVNILQYMPGVTDGSAFGGASDAGNSLMLDGVDTRDPEGGTAWTFYNYNIIEEVQVGSLGQPAEYGGFTGAVVNTITKSGGNRFSHLSEYRYTTGNNSFFYSNNADPSVTAVNPNLANPPKVNSMNDYTVQLGGPLVKDKAFFFTSFQRYSISQKGSGNYNRTEVSPRFNFKVTYQLSPSDTIIGSLQYDQYNQKGRLGLVSGYAVTNQNQTIEQDSPEAIYNAQYRKVFNSSTFLEAKYLGWWGYYDLNPVIKTPYFYNYDTGAQSGGAGYTYQADRTRDQVNVALSKYAQFAGTHNFKFGVEIERSSIRDRFNYSQIAQGVSGYTYQYSGYLYAWGYSYDFQGKNKRESYYAQDQWKLGRVTANLGLRLDNNRGEATTTGKELYKTFSVGPRLGLAWDVFGKGTSVARAYYGQLYDGGVFQSWSRAVPGLSDTVSWWFNPDTSAWEEQSRTSGASKYTIDPNIKHPRTDEFNVAWEQQLGKQLKLTATGIYRKWHNFQNSVLPGALWEGFTYNPPLWTDTGDATGTPYPSPNPVNTVPLTLYRWANCANPGSRSCGTAYGNIPQQFLITNVDNVVYHMVDGSTASVPADRTYKGLMLVLQKAYKDRWQAQLSYVLSKTDGTVSNSSGAGNRSTQFETPNSILVNRTGPTGYDRTHVVKIFAGYTIPRIELAVNGYWNYQSGYPFAANVSLNKRNFWWTSTISPNLDKRDAHLTNATSQLDLRLEKQVNYGIHRFGVYLDMANLFNQGIVNNPDSRYPNTSVTDTSSPTGESFVVPFGGPLGMQAGRQITLGLRWSF